MVSARSLMSNSSCPLTQLLWVVPSVPITTGITVIFIFHSFLSSLAIFLQSQGTYLSFHLPPISLCGLTGGQSSLLGKFWVFFLSITRSGRLAEIRWSVCISKSRRNLCVSFFKFEFLAQFPIDYLPTQSYLLLYSLYVKFLHLLIIIIIIIIINFSYLPQQVAFHRSLRDSKCLLVSQIFLSFGRPQPCCSLDGHDSSCDLQFF